MGQLRHLAVIMDGNRRWAEAQGKAVTQGHLAGVARARALLQACLAQGIPELTLYAFSSENWGRADREVKFLMRLLKRVIQQEMSTLNAHQIKFRMIGDRQRLAPELRATIERAEQATQCNKALSVTVAISYSGRWDILQATRQLMLQAKTEEAALETLDEARFASLLAIKSPPDLLIRTGGEQRLSNFLLWQSAYTEFYFTPTFWPDFSEAHLQAAFDAYQARQRRYGVN